MGPEWSIGEAIQGKQSWEKEVGEPSKQEMQASKRVRRLSLASKGGEPLSECCELWMGCQGEAMEARCMPHNTRASHVGNKYPQKQIWQDLLGLPKNNADMNLCDNEFSFGTSLYHVIWNSRKFICWVLSMFGLVTSFYMNAMWYGDFLSSVKHKLLTLYTCIVDYARIDVLRNFFTKRGKSRNSWGEERKKSFGKRGVSQVWCGITNRYSPQICYTWNWLCVLFSGKDQKVTTTLILETVGAKKGEKVWFNY